MYVCVYIYIYIYKHTYNEHEEYDNNLLVELGAAGQPHMYAAGFPLATCSQ